MPITITLTADSAGEMKDLVVGLAVEMTTEAPQHRQECHYTSNVTVQAPICPGANAPATDGPSPGTPVDEPEETDTAFEPDEDESLTSNDNDSDDETEDELSGCNDTPNDEIASHFDEIFGTVGNRPMCGDRVTINGSLFQGGGKVVNTNYSLLYDGAYDYNTKIIKVKAYNGKKYSYNKSDLRAKKVTKA